jgi:hypothetical protein
MPLLPIYPNTPPPHPLERITRMKRQSTTARITSKMVSLIRSAVMRGEGVICRLHGVEVGIVDVFAGWLVDTSGRYHAPRTLTIRKATIDTLTIVTHNNLVAVKVLSAMYRPTVIWEDTPSFASILPKEYSGV